MSVNSDMKKIELYVLEETESLSGAKKQKWNKLEDSVLMTIYQYNQFVSHEAFRNTETTHQALTYCRFLEAGKHRIVSDGEHYEILSTDPKHRLSLINLKRVEPW